MKKSLFALAALTTIAGTAQAQSSVTLFGLLDAGVYYINGASTANNNLFGVLGNTVSSSNWGLKGTEDLGGGLKANFYAESGINSRNGALGQSSASKVTGQTTLFDRGAYVGLSGNWGSLDIGNKLNPLWAANSAILPVSGNSVATNTAKTLGYGNSNFTHNSLTYTLPTMAGFNAAAQWGFGNAVSSATGGSVGGSVLSGSADYTIGGFSVRAAGQKRWGNGTYFSANFTGATSDLTTTSNNQSTYLVGAKYAISNFTLGAGFISNQITPGTGVATVNSATASNRYINNAYQVGVGYKATPAILLGLSWVGATSGSNLINAQARYAFSKRTQAYAQVGYAMNKGGLNNAGFGNFLALDGANGQVGTTKLGDAIGPNGFNQLGLGVGLIHTF